MANKEIFNREEYLNRVMNNPAIAVKIAAAFLDDVPKRMTDLEDSLKQGDQQNSTVRSHGLKGAALNLGAENLHLIAKEMEDYCNLGDLNSASAKLPDLTQALEALIIEIKAFIAEYGGE